MAVSRRSRAPRSKPVLLAAVLAPTAALLAACASGADLVSSVALPSEQTLPSERTAGDPADTVDVAAAPDTAAKTAPVELTDAQRGYLTALAGAGVHPSSELRALSIGSYVCQARAAGQSDQAVWDYVAPMVRSDVADSHASTQSAPGVQADAAVTTYVRIAAAHLC